MRQGLESPDVSVIIHAHVIQYTDQDIVVGHAVLKLEAAANNETV